MGAKPPIPPLCSQHYALGPYPMLHCSLGCSQQTIDKERIRRTHKQIRKLQQQKYKHTDTAKM